VTGACLLFLDSLRPKKTTTHEGVSS